MNYRDKVLKHFNFTIKEEEIFVYPNDKLFRKMYLYSELFSLDKSSTKEQKSY